MDGEIRTNLKVFDQEKSVVTEINESGPSVPSEMLDRLSEHVAGLARANTALVLTGSLPPGTPKDYYRRLLEKAVSSFNVLDAEGTVFLEGLTARPDMVKPNSYELSLAVDREIKTLEDVIHGAEILHGKGIRIVCVSMGSEGAYITNGTERYYAPPVDILILSTVGAGDCVVAGILSGLAKEKPLKECFRSGVDEVVPHGNPCADAGTGASDSFCEKRRGRYRTSADRYGEDARIFTASVGTYEIACG